MKGYTTNDFCDFLWIGDLLELKQDKDRSFSLEISNNGKPKKVNISKAIIFGTIVEVKHLGNSGVIYHVDDGTGVIACKHNEQQFEELLSSIENEQANILNQTLEYSHCDSSANDSIFNDRSLQLEEINFNKKSTLKGLQSIWDDLYDSFHCLIKPYTVGDTVIIQGKLYSYVHVNQLYVNTIRPLDIAEEIILTSIKLEDGLDKSKEQEALKRTKHPENRLSGLLTFDNIPHLNPKITFTRNIQTPEMRTEVGSSKSDIVTPNLETTMTFDTFTGRK